MPVDARRLASRSAERGVEESPVRSDDVRLSRLAETRPLDHDAIDPLQVEERCNHADPLTLRIEERSSDRDRRFARQVRGLNRLDVGPRPAAVEVRLRRLGDAFVLFGRRSDHLSLQVEDEELLGVRGLRHDVPERVDDRPVSLAAFGRGRAVVEELARATGPDGRGRVLMAVVAAQKPGREHDASALLVDPAVQRIRLLVGGGLEPGERRVPKSVPCADVGHGPDDADHDDGEDQEGQDEARDEAPPARRKPSPPARCGHRRLRGEAGTTS